MLYFIVFKNLIPHHYTEIKSTKLLYADDFLFNILNAFQMFRMGRQITVTYH